MSQCPSPLSTRAENVPAISIANLLTSDKAPITHTHKPLIDQVRPETPVEPLCPPTDTMPIQVPASSESQNEVPSKSAARRTYESPELLRRILEMADGRSLARMLCTERAATASVAELLYGEINENRVGKMARLNPRRSAYCDAVKVLDRSPIPKAEVFDQYRKRSQPERPQPVHVPFDIDAEKLLKLIPSWLTKYPNLREIRFEYPSNPLEDSYVVRLVGNKIHVDALSALLPPKPTYKGMTVDRHTIGIWATGGSRTQQWWSKWLYSGSLDPRVTSTNVSSVPVAFEDIVTFLIGRKEKQCEPITALYLDCLKDMRGHKTALTIGQWKELSEALGSQARILHVPNALFEGLGNMSELIKILDRNQPLLREIHISYDSYTSNLHLSFGSDCPPLSGLPNLRLLSFDPNFGRDEIGREYSTSSYDHGDVAKNVYQLGNGQCVFQNGIFKHQYQVKEFNEAIRKLWSDPEDAKNFTGVAGEHPKNHNGYNPGWKGRGGWF